MLVDYVAQTGNYSYTFAGKNVDAPHEIEFSNDGAADAVVTINDVAMTVKGGETLTVGFDAFNKVDVTGTPGAWRMILNG
jgi:hypothetical protein